MNDPGEMTPLAYAALGFEIALGLAGIWLLWRLVLRRQARTSAARRLGEWRLPPVDFACFLCFAFVGASVVSWLSGPIMSRLRLGEDALMVSSAAAMHVGILAGLGGFYLLYRRRDPMPLGTGPLREVLESGAATFLIAVPILFLVSNGWEFLLRAKGIPPERQELVDILENSRSAFVRGSLVLEATLLVPLTEELLFRGGLFRYARTRLPRWTAILFTSLLFGALHVDWGNHMSGIASFMPLTALAVIFCLAYERTGRLGTVVVAHALFNLNTFVLIFGGVGS